MPTWNEFAWATFYLWAISKGDKMYLDLMKGWNPIIYKKENIQEKIVVKFLNKWERCRIPKNTFRSVYIKDKIFSLQADLKVLHELEIDAVEFTQNIESAVENCYKTVRKNFGPTSTSKLLHLLEPGFFVMWDGAILKEYRNRNDDLKISDSDKGYCFFLKNMNIMAKEVIRDFHRASLSPPAKLGQSPADYLSKQMKYNPGKTMARYLDEYNWVTFTHGLKGEPPWHPKIKPELLSELL